jgi:hypothetical protein
MKINEELSKVTGQVLKMMGSEARLEAFDGVRLGSFVQDDKDWTDPNTGEFFKATMDYLSHLSGRRISDGTFFAVNLRLDHIVVDDSGIGAQKKLDYVETCMVNAMIQLAEYSNCACVVDAPCERHARQ